jgi:pimeloyl-ACP methyl ester carboxylesterase
MRFVLVHGGSHGAWCWDRLIPELSRLGHDCVAIDLPGHGTRSDERSTLTGYRDAVVEVLRPGDILVGHSTGCGVTTMAADAYEAVGHIVYLSGPLPVEGCPIAFDSGGNQTDDGALELVSAGKSGDGDGDATITIDDYYVVSPDFQTFTFDFEGARKCLYHDCTEETARWAYDQLTPQRIDVLLAEPVSVPNFWTADLPRSFIQCTRDRVFPHALSERTIRRLGVEKLTIDSSHSPFLSRPRELATLLERAVGTVPAGALVSGVDGPRSQVG